MRIRTFSTACVAVVLLSSFSPAREDEGEKFAKEWAYPGGQLVSTSSTSGSLSGLYQRTTDDPAKVFKWCAQKLGVVLANQEAPTGMSAGGLGNGAFIVVSPTPADLDDGTLFCLTHRNPNGTTNVVIHRPRDAKRTVVTITRIGPK